ncbi:hypothetical protein STEG23_023796, partial [Scotinomys teguina]
MWFSAQQSVAIRKHVIAELGVWVSVQYNGLDQEIEKLRLELSESKQHVEQEQQKAAQARQECLQVTELLGESERQLRLTRLEKDSIQQSFSNEVKTQALQAQQREQELTQKIQQMEAQHDKTENEQYSLLTSQNTFLTKVKEECCMLAKKLEKISQKSRSEIVRLSQEKRYMCDKLEKLQKRNDELEEQCIQHGRVHETMKERWECRGICVGIRRQLNLQKSVLSYPEDRTRVIRLLGKHLYLPSRFSGPIFTSVTSIYQYIATQYGQSPVSGSILPRCGDNVTGAAGEDKLGLLQYMELIKEKSFEMSASENRDPPLD